MGVLAALEGATPPGFYMQPGASASASAPAQYIRCKAPPPPSYRGATCLVHMLEGCCVAPTDEVWRERRVLLGWLGSLQCCVHRAARVVMVFQGGGGMGGPRCMSLSGRPRSSAHGCNGRF